jgi:hypothetical protein
MNAPRILLLGVALGVAVAGTVMVGLASRNNQGFPHEDHARLFPLCISCHEGVPTGDLTEFYPDPELCARCHDGIREEPVEWTGPTRHITNLDFSHPEHQTAADRPVECTECHTVGGDRREPVHLALATRCFDCHDAHPAEEHFLDAVCTNCHVPLAETRFSRARVAELPEPVTHQDPRFLAELHGELVQQDPTRCSTCHTRELCTTCHVDAQQVASIGEIPRAGEALELPAFVARYPVPESHLHPRWETIHGRIASAAECSTCHTRESCQTCHDEPGTRATRLAGELPSRRQVEAPGVVLAGRAPASHASPWFATRHGEVASTRRETCATCHARTTFCGACHTPIAAADLPEPVASAGRPVLLAMLATGEATGPVTDVAGVLLRAEAGGLVRTDTVPPPRPGVVDTVSVTRAGGRVHVPHEVTPAAARQARARAPRGGEFHPPGFATRHSTASYGRALDCAQCHNTRTFCRDCHTESGFQARGRLGQGFHDAEPVWLLRHGQAARQTLESCTTCHAQRDCMQCHSQLGAFRVNPHRTDFDARRAQRRNPAICFACHLSDPLGRSTP